MAYNNKTRKTVRSIFSSTTPDEIENFFMMEKESRDKRMNGRNRDKDRYNRGY